MGDEQVTRVEKPWGYELHWAKTSKYVGKVIHVNAGHALSLQYHNQKDETILLWSGRLHFEIQEGKRLVNRELRPGERVHIVPKTIHRIAFPAWQDPTNTRIRFTEPRSTSIRCISIVSRSHA